MKTILVVGGAGYIGSHMVWLLGQHDINVIVLDNLSSGHESSVLNGELVRGDLSDPLCLQQIFENNTIEAVIHFASSIQVGESITDPAKYYRNNVANGLNLLDAMIENNVKKLIFSSTAAIFGNPEKELIDEDHTKRPINTYGHTKHIFEQILSDYDHAYDLKSVCLRYFNAAGAHPDGLIGERHDPETHLIPLVLDAAAGRKAEITIFGRDYETRDGTCIRDYVHVLDLAEAHWLALNYLLEGGESAAYNLGNGQGYSVSEVVSMVEKITRSQVPVTYGPRRPGDPAILVADSTKMKRELGWQPRFPELADIVSHAWRWHSNAHSN